MNKSIFHSIITIVIFLNCGCSSIKIATDIPVNGDRMIMSESQEMKIGDASYDFYLALLKVYNSKKYLLGVSSLWHIEDYNVLLLKLGNDETVKLIADNVEVNKIDWPKYIPIIGSTSNYGISTTEKVDYYSSSFEIDVEILDKIEKYGIDKIRIAFFNEYFEQNRGSRKLGRYILKSRKKLDSEYEKPIKPTKSIEENF